MKLVKSESEGPPHVALSSVRDADVLATATGARREFILKRDGTVFAAVATFTTICTLYVALWDGDWPTTSSTVASYCATGVLACMVSRLLYPN